MQANRCFRSCAEVKGILSQLGLLISTLLLALLDDLIPANLIDGN
jgi:hypothetical protein